MADLLSDHHGWHLPRPLLTHRASTGGTRCAQMRFTGPGSAADYVPIAANYGRLLDGLRLQKLPDRVRQDVGGCPEVRPYPG